MATTRNTQARSQTLPGRNVPGPARPLAYTNSTPARSCAAGTTTNHVFAVRRLGPRLMPRPCLAKKNEDHKDLHTITHNHPPHNHNYKGGTNNSMETTNIAEDFKKIRTTNKLIIKFQAQRQEQIRNTLSTYQLTPWQFNQLYANWMSQQIDLPQPHQASAPEPAPSTTCADLPAPDYLTE